MRVSILAFAAYREAIGARRLRLEVPEGSTAGQVWEVLAERYPPLWKMARPAAFAVNEMFVPPQIVLHEADELLLIPPMSGGAAYRVSTR